MKYNNPMEQTKLNNLNLKITNVIKPLNIDKIKTLDDVKRILKFLNIEVEMHEGIIRNGFEEVKDLFE
jgi:hypothetical protein